MTVTDNCLTLIAEEANVSSRTGYQTQDHLLLRQTRALPTAVRQHLEKMILLLKAQVVVVVGGFCLCQKKNKIKHYYYLRFVSDEPSVSVTFSFSRWFQRVALCCTLASPPTPLQDAHPDNVGIKISC